MKLFEITNREGIKATLNLVHMHSFRCMTLETDGADLAGLVRLVMPNLPNYDVYVLDGASSESFLNCMKDFTITCASTCSA